MKINMRILGIDYGDARVGVAVSDIMGWTAQGVGTVKNRGIDNLIAELDKIIKEYMDGHPDYEWIEESLYQYHKARRVRKKVRKMRRAILYLYYFIFMLMFLLLLLHTELSTIISNGSLGEVDLNLFTLWSLIVVLIEIMMKDIFEDIVGFFLDKKIGINLEWYQ